MKNLGPQGILEELKKLYKDDKKAKFDLMEGPPPKIIGCIPAESLAKLPEGYYVNHQGNITNRKSVAKGEPYDNLLYSCDVNYFVSKEKEAAKQAKKDSNPLFKPLFGGKKKKK